MRTTWEALQKQEEERVHTQEAIRIFNQEKQKWPVLEPFEEPADLIDYLTGEGRDLDHKDEIYAALVEISQEKSCWDLGVALLWLGLWPGLDSFYRKEMKDYKGNRDELVASIWDCFSRVVLRLRLDRVNRVASTINKNTKRDVRTLRKKAWVEQKRTVELSDLDRLEIADSRKPRIDISDLGIPPGISREREIEYLERLVAEVLKDDAELVIGAVIYKKNQRLLAEKMNISHAAAGKRVQRGLQKIKKHFLEKK